MLPDKLYTCRDGSQLIAAVRAVNHCSKTYCTIYFYKDGLWLNTRVQTTPELLELNNRQRKVFYRERRSDGSTEIRAGVRVQHGVIELLTGDFKSIPNKWLCRTFSECAREDEITDKTWQDDICLVNFSWKLRRILRHFCLTQQEFAERIGVKPPQVSEWIHGKCLPSYENLRTIALTLEIGSDFLLGLEDRIRQVIRED